MNLLVLESILIKFNKSNDYFKYFRFNCFKLISYTSKISSDIY